MNDDFDAIIDRLATGKFLVVGDVMLDKYTWGDVTRISPEAPVPVVNVFRDTWAAGGAANVALNLTSIGATTKIAGVCGDDDAGAKLREIFAENGVDHGPLQLSATAPTIQKTRIVVQKQQICRVDRESAPATYGVPNLDAFYGELDSVDAVIVSDYAKGVVTEDLVQRLAVSRTEGKRLIAVDPKPRRHLAYSGVDLMTPNRSEALEMAGIAIGLHDAFPAQAVCDAIWREFKPHRLVVTLGADGMLLVEEGKLLGRLPTLAREVFDVSGAGDTVIAVLTAALATGAGLEQAGHLANAAAGIVVGKFGPATVKPDELKAALRADHSKLVSL